MRRKFFSLLLVLSLLINFYGCAPLIVGVVAGAVGVVAVSRDTIQGDTDKDFDRVWESAVMVARSRGTVKKEDRSSGYLHYAEYSSNIYINIVRLTHSTIRVKVSARKYHMPALTLAQDVFVKIIDGAS